MTRTTNKTELSSKPLRRSLSSSQPLFFQLLLLVSAILVTATRHGVAGFSLSSLTASCPPSSLVSTSTSTSTPRSSSSFPSRLDAVGDSSINDDDDAADNRGREFARIRRRRGRGGYAENENDDGYETDRFGDSVMDAADLLEDEGFFEDMDDEYDYDDDDDDDDEEYDDESYDMFSNSVIPNPILDSIDPDGSAERFPELAADPRFWLDMFLFIAFLNFISFIGPRNPFPEMIPAMYTAGLPPPGV